MNLDAAKNLLKGIQERSNADSFGNFIAAKAQLEHSEAMKTYLGYLATDYTSLTAQEAELTSFLGLEAPSAELPYSADAVVDELLQLRRHELTLQKELVTFLGNYRMDKTAKKLAILRDMKEHPSGLFYPSRVLSGAEYHEFELNLQKLSYEAEELVNLLMDSGRKIALCPATLTRALYITPVAQQKEQTAIACKVSPAAYWLAAIIRPFEKHLASKLTQANIQGLKKAHSVLAKVFGSRVDTASRTVSPVKTKMIVPLAAVQEALQSLNSYASLMETISLRFSHLKQTLQYTADSLEWTELTDDQLAYNFDAYLARATKLYEDSKAASKEKALLSKAAKPASAPEPRRVQAVEEAVRIAKEVAQYKASKEADKEEQKRAVQLSGKLLHEAMEDLAPYRAGVIELRRKLLEQEKKRQAQALLQYEVEERKRREAAEADAASVRPHVERSRERVLAPTAALLNRREANKARAQLLGKEGKARIFQTDLAINGELLTMAGKSGLVHDNQENAVSTIATELMAQYGILGTQYARDALNELRGQEIAQRFHHYSIRDTVSNLFA